MKRYEGHEGSGGGQRGGGVDYGWGQEEQGLRNTRSRVRHPQPRYSREPDDHPAGGKSGVKPEKQHEEYPPERETV